MAESLAGFVDAVERVGMFPAAANDIFKVLRDREAAVAQLEAAISKDPIMAGRLLKVANSAFYGRPRRVRALRDATVLLGFNATRDLCLSFALAGMSRTASPVAKPLWSHALLVGSLASSLARASKRSDPAAALVVGILHDLGQLVLLEVEGTRYQSLLQRVGTEDHRLSQAERMLFGLTHSDVGAACLARWGLPDDYIKVVRTHHEVEEPTSDLAALVRLADEAELQYSRGTPIEQSADDLAAHPANHAVKLAPSTFVGVLKRLMLDAADLGL